MKDEEILREIDRYIEAQSLKQIPIDKAFPLIAQYAKTIDVKHGNNRTYEELLEMYLNWLSEDSRRSIDS